jgi:hypothetical protein
MKTVAILAVISVTVFFETAGAQSWQELSSGLFTNAEIVWRVPTNALPKNLWVYHRLLPHVFSATVILNAIVLGSLQSRGFPRSTTHYFSMTEQVPENWPGPIPVIFALQPGDAYLSYSIPHNGPISRKEVPMPPHLLHQT